MRKRPSHLRDPPHCRWCRGAPDGVAWFTSSIPTIQIAGRLTLGAGARTSHHRRRFLVPARRRRAAAQCVSRSSTNDLSDGSLDGHAIRQICHAPYRVSRTPLRVAAKPCARTRKSHGSVGTQVRLSLANYSTQATSVSGSTANEVAVTTVRDEFPESCREQAKMATLMNHIGCVINAPNGLCAVSGLHVGAVTRGSAPLTGQ